MARSEALLAGSEVLLTGSEAWLAGSEGSYLYISLEMYPDTVDSRYKGSGGTDNFFSLFGVFLIGNLYFYIKK